MRLHLPLVHTLHTKCKIIDTVVQYSLTPHRCSGDFITEFLPNLRSDKGGEEASEQPREWHASGTKTVPC